MAEVIGLGFDGETQNRQQIGVNEAVEKLAKYIVEPNGVKGVMFSSDERQDVFDTLGITNSDQHLAEKSFGTGKDSRITWYLRTNQPDIFVWIARWNNGKEQNSIMKIGEESQRDYGLIKSK